MSHQRVQSRICCKDVTNVYTSSPTRTEGVCCRQYRLVHMGMYQQCVHSKVCVINVYTCSPLRTKSVSWRQYVRVHQRMFHQPVHSRSVANNMSSPMDTLRVYGKQVEHFPTLTMRLHSLVYIHQLVHLLKIIILV